MKKVLPVLLSAFLLLGSSCSRSNYATTRKADPQKAPYAPTRTMVSPSNTGDNTAGHQNREIRATTPASDR